MKNLDILIRDVGGKYVILSMKNPQTFSGTGRRRMKDYWEKKPSS